MTEATLRLKKNGERRIRRGHPWVYSNEIDIEKTPLKRTGEIDEVVSTAQFCIENDFFNGEVLNLNGGLII